MLTPSPEVAIELDKLMRADLIIGRDLLSQGLFLATKLVAVGLGLEIFELLPEILAICRSKYDKYILHITFPEHQVADWAKALAFAGWMLILVGVVGEWVTSSRIDDVGIIIEQINDDLLTAAWNKAGDADKSAMSAHREAAAASLEIKEGLKIAKKLSLFANRPALLEQNKTALIKALKGSQPQRIFIFSCGNDDEFGNREANDTREKLVALLGTDGAGWEVRQVTSTRDDCPVRLLSNPPGNGGIVLALSVTQSPAKQSALVASQKLVDALNNMRITASIGVETRVNNMPDTVPAYDVWKSLNDDPKAIFLLVGDNPLE